MTEYFPSDSAQAHNPVFRAELLHMQRASPKQSERWLTRIFLLALLVSIALQGGIYLIGRSGSMTTGNLRQTYGTVSDLLQNVNLILLLLVFAQHVLMVSGALLASSAVIVREKQARTWESLVLTGLPARQIVTGKWSAIFELFWYTHRTGIFLRAAAVFWLGLTTERGNFLQASPSVFALFVAPLAVLAYSPANLALTSAVGLFASCLSRGTAMAFRLAMGMSFAIILSGLTLSLGFLFTLPGDSGAAFFPLGITPVEGGMLLAFDILTDPQWLWGALGGAAGLLVYAALTWGLLWLARAVAARQGAS